MCMDFDPLWRASVRYRRVSRELEPLVHDVYTHLGELAALRSALEKLLVFLASDAGRTDANCSATCNFFSATEAEWSSLPEEFRSVCDDMGGTLHDAIYAPDIARTFEATPEQLLERVRRLNSS